MSPGTKVCRCVRTTARRRVKDMSSGEEAGGAVSDDGSDDAPDADTGAPALLPQQQNDFDRLQLLASDSSEPGTVAGHAWW